MTKFKKNLFYVFLAQGTALLLSIVLNLVLPKEIGKLEFGYWQFFLLLAGYAGFFTIGFNDGYYLKEGGKTREELDLPRVNSEFYLFVCLQLLFVGLVFFSSYFFEQKRWLIVVFGIYIFFQNISNFFGFVFQASGKFKKYSFSVLADKLFFLISLLILIFFNASSYFVFIIFYTVGKMVSVSYCLYELRSFFFLQRPNIKESTRNFISTVLVGINIMFANILGGLIIGGGRFLIEEKWGIKVFGEVSLSFSFTYFFLLFVTQIGIVLFPMLKRFDADNRSNFFRKAKLRLDILLPIILICFYPLKIFIGFWLPEYLDSIRYLIILLPVCLYEGKFHMLYLVFYKALRKEKTLLIINVFTFLLSFILCVISTYLFNSLIIVLVSIVFSIIARSLYSEFVLNKENIKIGNEIWELLLVVSFVWINWNLDSGLGIFLFGLSFIIYYIINFKKVKLALERKTFV